ncbi:hypothetical protein ACFL35_18470 [Candidatus Riflebacteria bacterium]
MSFPKKLLIVKENWCNWQDNWTLGSWNTCSGSCADKKTGKSIEEQSGGVVSWGKVIPAFIVAGS